MQVGPLGGKETDTETYTQTLRLIDSVEKEAGRVKIKEQFQTMVFSHICLDQRCERSMLQFSV